MYRTDDNTGVIHTRFLEQREAPVFKRITAPSDINKYLPTFGDLNFGAEEQVFEYADRVGEASITSGSPDNVPFVEAFVNEEKSPIVTIMAGYRYGVTELDKLEFAKSNGQLFGGNISTYRMEAALEAMQLKEHLLGCYGSPSNGIYGLFNNPNVPAYDETTLDVYDSATTADDLHTWYVDTIHATIKAATLLTEAPKVILQPDRLTTKLCNTFRNSASDATAMDLIENTLKRLGIQQIVSRNELTASWLEKYGVLPSGTDKDMLFIYDLDPSKLNRRISPVRTMPWEYNNGAYKRLLYQRIGSVNFHYPLSGMYVTFAKYA